MIFPTAPFDDVSFLKIKNSGTWLKSWLTITIRKEMPYTPVISAIWITGRLLILGMREKIPGQSEKKEIGTDILQRHPQRGRPNDDPGSDIPAHQAVKNAEYKKIQAQRGNHEQQPVQDADLNNIAGPGKRPNEKKYARQKGQAGSENRPCTAECVKQRCQPDPCQYLEIKRRVRGGYQERRGHR